MVYLGNYAGDSQVHLIYGENASHGRFFEFNNGEKSPGVTSPAYMLLIASYFVLLPDYIVPVALKITNLLAWYGLLALIFLSTRRLMVSTGWAVVATLIAGLIPGSVYNSNIGMENGIFAFMIFLWFYQAMRRNWFFYVDRQYITTELFLGSIMGIICWVRPEGTIVAVIAIMFRIYISIKERQSKRQIALQNLLFILPVLLSIILLVSFHYLETGYILPTSGYSRVLMSNISPDSYQVGTFYFSSRLSERLLAYFPITGFGLLTFWLVLTRRITLDTNYYAVTFLLVMFTAGFAFYSTFIGSVHISRYVIFLMPALVIVGMFGVRWLWQYHKHESSIKPVMIRGAVIALGICLTMVFIYETTLRLNLDSQNSLTRTMKAPADRQITSDALYEFLGEPSELPIALALQEVQLRYWLDERFVIRSLDGRVDPLLLEYAGNDTVDHLRYLFTRRVDFLLETPSYNRSSDIWSLEKLHSLNNRETLQRSNIIFTKIPISWPQNYSIGSAFDSVEGPIFLQWFVKQLFELRYIDQ